MYDNFNDQYNKIVDNHKKNSVNIFTEQTISGIKREILECVKK